MDFLVIVAYAAQAAIAVIILYYVVEFLPIPEMMKRAVQLLIVLLAILSVINISVGKPAPTRTLSPLPSIIR